VDAANLSAGQPLDMYDTDAVERVAVNLFYGWGYNFYRVENHLRADDLLARHHVAGIVAEARKTVDRAEAAFRAEKLPPPTREKPTHDPQAMRDVATLDPSPRPRTTATRSAIVARRRRSPACSRRIRHSRAGRRRFGWGWRPTHRAGCWSMRRRWASTSTSSRQLCATVPPSSPCRGRNR
jgi:uncharacterized membrane protein